MLSFPPAVRIWLALAPADLRKGFDALAELVRQHLRDDPLSGHVLRWPSLSPSLHRWFLSRFLALLAFLGFPPRGRDEVGRGGGLPRQTRLFLP